MATPPVDSSTLLSDGCKAFRVKVIAHLMTCEGLVSLNDVKTRLAKEMDEACIALYDNGAKPADVSVNAHHLLAWGTIAFNMSTYDYDEYTNLSDNFSYHSKTSGFQDIDCRWPRSPEYDVLYNGRMAEKAEERARLVERVTAIWEEFDAVAGVPDRTRKNELFGGLLVDILLATGEKKMFSKHDFASLITKIWNQGASDNVRQAAEEWCALHGYDHRDLL